MVVKVPEIKPEELRVMFHKFNVLNMTSDIFICFLDVCRVSVDCVAVTSHFIMLINNKIN